MKSQLFNLVKMALMASKKNLYLFFIMPLIYPALFRGTGNLDVISYLFCIGMVGFLLFNGFAESDEKFKTDIMLNTLPVKRNEIIQARFVSMYITYTVITLLYILSATILHNVKPEMFGIFNLSSIPIGLVLVSLINLVQIPLYYILDIQKSRVIGMIIMFGAIALISYLSTKSWLENFIQYFYKMNLAFRNCVFLLFAVLVYVIACRISEKAYQRKEF